MRESQFEVSASMRGETFEAYGVTRCVPDASHADLER
jgi:hypothetical protein